MSKAKKKTEKVKETERLKILYVTSEAVPFVHTGGLGEVASALPKNLNSRRQQDVDCRVILPLHGSVAQEYRDKMEFLGSGEVRLAWRAQYMGVFSSGVRWRDVLLSSIMNTISSGTPVRQYDDCERFAYFSKAVFDALDIIDFVPDIIHANDWQTALVPVYQYAVYRREFTKTVFTIHNVEYQGITAWTCWAKSSICRKNMGHLVEYNGDVNLMKGAIECADVFSTVSPTYAEELKDPAFGFGLDPIVRKNEGKLIGILNGIDTLSYNPSKDKAIAGELLLPESLRARRSARKALQEEFGLPLRDVPVISMVTRLVAAKGMDIVAEFMDRILDEMDVQFVLLGTGDQEYEDFFRGLQSTASG